MNRMLCSNPSKQSIPGSCLVARAVEDAAEENLNHMPAMNPVQDNDPDGQVREVNDYENQNYVEKAEETQFSYDTGLSDQELEDAIRLEVLRNRLGRPVNVTFPWISSDQRDGGDGIQTWIQSTNMRLSTVYQCIMVETKNYRNPMSLFCS